MEGGGGASLMQHRNSAKRNSSTMSASGRHDSSDSESLFMPHDDHYENEHPSVRPRMETASFFNFPPPPAHFSGDGLDFRRPAMSTAPAFQADEGNDAASLIDLTEQDDGNNSQSMESPDSTPEARLSSSGGRRAWNFEDPVINLEDDAGEEGEDTSRLPGSNYLDRPPIRFRPQLTGPNRPVPRRSPSRDNEDEPEFLETRSIARQSLEGHRPSGYFATQSRSVTPYPHTNGFSEPIDLTEDDDDDIVITDERVRDGVNVDRPTTTARVGAGSRTSTVARGIDRFADLLGQGRLLQRVLESTGSTGNLGAGQRDTGPFDHNHGHHYPQQQQQQQQQRYRGPQHQPYHSQQPQPQQQQQQQQQNHQHRHAQQHHHLHHHPSLQHPHDPRQRPLRNYREILGPDFFTGDPGTRPFANDPSVRIPSWDILDFANATLPGFMDYQTPAFELGLPGGNRPSSPKYSAPKAPGTGFTRSPEEDEVVVCPNCGDELGMGDSAEKQKIWAIRGCGHVYCGRCASHRSQGSIKKGKGKEKAMDGNLPPLLKRCVVEGCLRTASKASLIPIFMSG